MPQVALTIQAMVEELEGFCEYEIIVVDNRSDDKMLCTNELRSTPVPDKNYFIPGLGKEKFECYQKPRSFPLEQRKYFRRPDTGKILSTFLFRQGKIKYFIYDEKLSHWNAKNYGIEHSKGKYIFFLDAHCIMKRDSVRKMIEFLRNPPEAKIGGVHAYINYMLDSNCLEYRPQRKFFGYQFCSHQNDIEIRADGKRIPHWKTKPYKVCVMSTCGMMCPRSVIEELGGWNAELGIYGGGESYLNWKQSTCGYSHWIHPEAWCWHFADKRGYSWNHSDYVRNSFIAAYCVGDEKWLGHQVELRKKKDHPDIIEQIAENVRTTCRKDMEFIKSKQVMTFDEYIDFWEANPGTWK